MLAEYRRYALRAHVRPQTAYKPREPYAAGTTARLRAPSAESSLEERRRFALNLSWIGIGRCPAVTPRRTVDEVEVARAEQGNYARVTTPILKALICNVLFICGMLTAPQTGAQVPSVERGRALYENHCVVCHTSKLHARANRIPVSRAEVRAIVEHWQTQQKLTWSALDVEDVVEFLNRTRYHFP